MNTGLRTGLGIAVVLLAVGAAYFWVKRASPPSVETVPPAVSDEWPVADVMLDETVAAEPPAPAELLPELDRSDAAMQEALIQVFGTPPVEAFLIPERIVRRIVATVDSLDNDPVRLKIRPAAQVQGLPVVDVQGDTITLSAHNADRYLPFVSALEVVDATQLAGVYRRYAPLFQKAYAELGFPDRSFDDRLIEVIDHLLATPEVAAPIRLVRPKVLYEFADPKLERRSWGQKTLIRMGAEHAATVKTKLHELRTALTGRDASG